MPSFCEFLFTFNLFFSAQFQFSFRIEAQRFGTPEDSWIEAETVDSHVRATTIKSLIPDNKYKFRIKMVRDDGTHVVSLPTDFMSVEATSGDVLPMSPKV